MMSTSKDYQAGFAAGHEAATKAFFDGKLIDEREILRIRYPAPVPMVCDITKAVTKRGRYPDARVKQDPLWFVIIRGEGERP